MTLLDIVQDILSNMSSDNVNSINDTEEALQAARIVRTTYFELISGGDWPHLKEMFQLTGLGDTNKPSHMRLPTNVAKVTNIKYNKSETGTIDWSDVFYVDPEYFLEQQARLDSTSDTVETVTDPSSILLLIGNDAMPKYYTSFDDDYIVMNSYLKTVDVTLQQSKTLCTGFREPVFTMVDTFIPDLPSKAFSLLLAECNSAASVALRNEANAKEEQRARRQRSWLGTERHRLSNKIGYPNYGR